MSDICLALCFAYLGGFVATFALASLARFSDLDRYAVPRQDLARTVRSAVNMAADYLWDPVDEVCYRRQMSGGFLDYVAVTNIDVTLPENWQALEALETERRSQQ